MQIEEAHGLLDVARKHGEDEPVNRVQIISLSYSLNLVQKGNAVEAIGQRPSSTELCHKPLSYFALNVLLRNPFCHVGTSPQIQNT
jgi:hypothetical protein